MLNRIPFIQVLLAGLIFLTPSTWAQTTEKDPNDRVFDVLEAKRRSYETSMERDVRNEVMAALNRKLNAANDGATVDENIVAVVTAEKEAFRKDGTWPDVPRIDQIRQRAARIAKELTEAYDKASLHFTKVEDRQWADVIKSARDTFSTSSDIVPWRSLGLEDVSNEQRVLVVDGDPLTLAIPLEGAYRLHIMGKRRSESGQLVVAFPLADGRPMILRFLPERDGDFNIYMTLGTGANLIDLGSRALVDWSKAGTGVSRELTLTASDASIEIIEVAAKPILEGSPEEFTATPLVKPNRVADPNDALVAGVLLVGERITGDGKSRPEPSAKIESRNGKEIVLVTERLDGNGKLLRTIRLGANGKLTPTGLIARGGPLGNFEVRSGSGTFDGTTLKLHTAGKVSWPGTTNQSFEDTLTLRLR